MTRRAGGSDFSFADSDPGLWTHRGSLHIVGLGRGPGWTRGAHDTSFHLMPMPIPMPRSWSVFRAECRAMYNACSQRDGEKLDLDIVLKAQSGECKLEDKTF